MHSRSKPLLRDISQRMIMFTKVTAKNLHCFSNYVDNSSAFAVKNTSRLLVNFFRPDIISAELNIICENCCNANIIESLYMP